MTSLFPLIISFYTIGTPYEQEVKRLIDSCERFGLEHHIVGVPNKGKWVLNCAMKGPFARDQLEDWQRTHIMD